jgi:hypothetical protein
VAVVGWEWYQSKEGVKAVILILDRGWQWQYWLSCGGLKNRYEKWKKKKWCGGWRAIRCVGGGEGWQWRGGSGTVGFVRSVRFEWYWFERGSGSIGLDTRCSIDSCDFLGQKKSTMIKK